LERETDKKLFDKMKIPNILTYLNIKSYDKNNDNHHHFSITDMNNNRELFSIYIGRLNKEGRMLNLTETHSLICKADHRNVTHSHDPLTDVIYTRCIFNHLIKLMKPTKIYKNFNQLKYRK
jgi:hypothetical protein